MTLPDRVTSRRTFSLPADAIDEICEGYLQVIYNLDEAWSVGLLSDAHGRGEEYALASQLRADGTPLLLLWDDDLLALSRGRCIETTDPAGARYLIKPYNVDTFEQLDEDDED